jgi:hypothetical protein
LGTVVTVIKELSASETSKRLPAGSSGHVIQINAVGDARIQFVGVSGVTAEWVRKQEFDKLSCASSSRIQWKDNLRSALNDASSRWSARRTHFTLHEHLEQRLFAAVKAVWTVEKKTVTDLVMKACRDSILKQREHWVQTVLLTDQQIKDAAVKESNVTSRRDHLDETIAAMKESLRILDSIMFTTTFDAQTPQ